MIELINLLSHSAKLSLALAKEEAGKYGEKTIRVHHFFWAR